MDILVCGAQVPFTSGGAELHMENLVSELRRAGHRAELVRLPTAWDKQRVLDAAFAWRNVPLDADLVIATNFPSYFAKHPRKVVWLFHQHRNAYDGIDNPWSDYGDDAESIELQRLLTEWDTVALREAERVFTTSAVVADRLARYNGLRGEPLHHPPPLHDRLHPGSFGDYVFSATRLEHNKRPGPLVEALAHVRTPTRVVIAGRGSLADPLAHRAKELGVTDRLELAGFVPDDALVELYAGCLGVVYAPVDEDYGYVTLQAFLAGKPVITAKDSGGTLEWVEHGVTGLVTDGTPAGLADAIDELAADPAAAQAMGEAGAARVRAIGWDNVIRTLVPG